MNTTDQCISETRLTTLVLSLFLCIKRNTLGEYKWNYSLYTG